jgi:hypothetical protein
MAEQIHVERIHYEMLLAEYSNSGAAIALLKQHRPYLEMLPSMRRPEESLMTLPLPVIQRRTTREETGVGQTGREALRVPCDVAFLMCDPEWKIKTGVEVFVFIHRPQEDFSDLLGRWRQTQVLLSRGYEWDLPWHYQHILNEGADKRFPLFVVFSETPERIKRGLKGAFLPFVIQDLEHARNVEATSILPELAADSEIVWVEGEGLD